MYCEADLFNHLDGQIILYQSVLHENSEKFQCGFNLKSELSDFSGFSIFAVRYKGHFN